jgi:nicotinamidase-related amidase
LPPAERVLKACRAAGIFVIHTREGHRADLSDLPPSKKVRGRGKVTIGDVGPMGRILVRGELGHDIVEEVYPIDGEPVVDKPGKGAFYATDLDAILKMKGIKQLVVCGVTTEVCVHTSVREANDRGYDALVLSDAVGSYFPEFQRVALEMIKAQGGIFGWVSDSERFLRALATATGREPAAAGAAVG